VVEEDNEQEPIKKQSDRKKAEKNMSSEPVAEASAPAKRAEDEGEESDDEDEEEEEDYDIDE
jgi:hypothetical protein